MTVCRASRPCVPFSPSVCLKFFEKKVFSVSELQLFSWNRRSYFCMCVGLCPLPNNIYTHIRVCGSRNNFCSISPWPSSSLSAFSLPVTFFTENRSHSFSHIRENMWREGRQGGRERGRVSEYGFWTCVVHTVPVVSTRTCIRCCDVTEIVCELQ